MKGVANLVWIALAILVVIGIGTQLPATLDNFEGCTWASDYCWASCVEYGSTQNLYQSPTQCPNAADVHECDVLSLGYMSGAIEAHIYSTCSQDGWFGTWVCEGFVKNTFVGDFIGRGQWLVSNLPGGGGVSATLKIERKAIAQNREKSYGIFD